MLKAIWRLGDDESFNAVYRNVAWEDEKNLLESFDLYIHNLQTHPQEAADFARGNFGRRFKTFFVTLKFEKKVMRLIRKRSEMPDDRGPLAFARRAGLPLLGAAAFGIGVVICRFSSLLMILLGLNMALFAVQSARVIWAKLQKVRRIHRVMRASLDRNFSAPAEYCQTDLSEDKTSTLLKYFEEIAALGAKHLCDVAIKTKTHAFDSTRTYTLENVSLRIGLLRQSESQLYFPPKPLLFAVTSFSGGGRHTTVDHALYRRQSRPSTTARCLLNSAGPQEVLEAHRLHVQTLVAKGLVPLPPSTSVDEELQRMRTLGQESREARQKSPYSWGDAVHQAFKVCRREYLDD
jgi:hypothetical protein